MIFELGCHIDYEIKTSKPFEHQNQIHQGYGFHLKINENFLLNIISTMSFFAFVFFFLF